MTLESLKLCEKFVKWNNTIAGSTRSHLGDPKKYDVIITNRIVIITNRIEIIEISSVKPIITI